MNGLSGESAKVPKQEFLEFSADEMAGVGIDMATTVSETHGRAFSKFIGKIGKVTIQVN